MLVARIATGDRRQKIEPARRDAEKLFLLWAHHDLYGTNAGNALERFDGAPEHGYAREGLILLGNGSARPRPRAGGDDQEAHAQHRSN